MPSESRRQKSRAEWASGGMRRGWKEAPPLTHHHGLQTFFHLLYISQIHDSTILFLKEEERFHGSCAM